VSLLPNGETVIGAKIWFIYRNISCRSKITPLAENSAGLSLILL
jgi:hypothetical protein